MAENNTPQFSGPFDCTDEGVYGFEDMVFVFSGNVEYRLPSHHWVKSGFNSCSHRFVELDITSNDNGNMFLLGDTFMNLFYTVFDRDNDRVGFATAIHTEPEMILANNELVAIDADYEKSMIEVDL